MPEIRLGHKETFRDALLEFIVSTENLSACLRMYCNEKQNHVELVQFTITSSFTKSPSNFLAQGFVIYFSLYYKRKQTDRFSVDTINSNRASLKVSLRCAHSRQYEAVTLKGSSNMSLLVAFN